MRVIFMGTPDFAVPSLQALLDHGYDVCLVVTQPDKPKGRGNKMSMSPVKELALAHNIPVLQPEKVKNEAFPEALRSYHADVTVTVAYGKILPEAALTATPLGCINVHASLLPKYRGSAPLWWVLINGEAKTGITTMFTDVGMDTGDMLEVAEFPIPEDMTVGELSDQMAVLGADALLTTLEKLQAGTLVRTPQNGEEATYAPMITKTQGAICWSAITGEIHNLVRGTNPWPGAYTWYEGQRMRIVRTKKGQDNGGKEASGASAQPGTILKVSDEGLLVATGDGTILVEEIQFDSSRKMSVKDYIRGHQMQEGVVLAQPEVL